MNTKVDLPTSLVLLQYLGKYLLVLSFADVVFFVSMWVALEPVYVRKQSCKIVLLFLCYYAINMAYAQSNSGNQYVRIVSFSCSICTMIFKINRLTK